MMTGSGAAAAEGVSTLEGANDWHCRPSAMHPYPVVLVHGTGMGSTGTWRTLAPALATEGYCVFTLDYGKSRNFIPGTLMNMFGAADIRSSARELAEFIDRVRAATGVEQVDIVGHSQGGVVARQYMRFEGGADPENPESNKVRKLVTLGATNHGTTFGAVQLVGAIAERFGVPVVSLMNAVVGQSYVQQMVGSPFLRELNSDGDTVPGVEYTVVASRNDTVSSPPENTFLTAGPGAVVHNLWVQDVSPNSVVDHMGLTSDPVVISIVKSALDPDHGEAVPPQSGK